MEGGRLARPSGRGRSARRCPAFFAGTPLFRKSGWLGQHWLGWRREFVRKWLQWWWVNPRSAGILPAPRWKYRRIPESNENGLRIGRGTGSKPLANATSVSACCNL